jgi:hypothetical protein
MKAALGVQLAEELFTGFGLRGQASQDCIDVFIDGFAIRLYLHSQRYTLHSLILHTGDAMCPGDCW